MRKISLVHETDFWALFYSSNLKMQAHFSDTRLEVSMGRIDEVEVLATYNCRSIRGGTYEIIHPETNL